MPRLVHHALQPATPGVHAELVSLHYGTPGDGPKAMLQASLHADEIAAMLVAHHLRQRLDALEAAGRLRGEVVLVPVANPLGLSQRLLHGPLGRFDADSGENFNRHYANLVEAVAQRVEGRLSLEPAHNVHVVREALRASVAALPVRSALDSLRRTLLGLAIDADLVLDLHTDSEAVLHLYTATPVWPRVEPLARLLGARAALLATASGDDPFDEACSMVWPQLAARFGTTAPLPDACVAVTIELRGESDVSHALAARDADALVAFLAHEGLVDGPPPVLPPPSCEATPLAGSIPVRVPHAGVVVWERHPGDVVREGEPLGEVVDPMTGRTTVLPAPVDGVLYAREYRRFAVAGASVCKVAGREPLRHGKLLSA